VKPPAFGAPFPMHQDYPYFPHESHTMLASAIHIDAADVENGFTGLRAACYADARKIAIPPSRRHRRRLFEAPPWLFWLSMVPS
jgi:hypothetical protein